MRIKNILFALPAISSISVSASPPGAQTPTAKDRPLSSVKGRKIFSSLFASFIMIAISVVGLTQPALAGAKTYPIVGSGGKCIDVPSENNRDGADLWMWSCTGGIAQQFTFEGRHLKVMGKCLDIRNAAKVNGTAVQLWDCKDVPQQKWKIRGEGIFSPFTGKCLDVSGNASTNKARLQIWECNGTAAQLFPGISQNRPVPGPAAIFKTNTNLPIEGSLHKIEFAIAAGTITEPYEDSRYSVIWYSEPTQLTHQQALPDWQGIDSVECDALKECKGTLETGGAPTNSRGYIQLIKQEKEGAEISLPLIMYKGIRTDRWGSKPAEFWHEFPTP